MRSIQARSGLRSRPRNRSPRRDDRSSSGSPTVEVTPAGVVPGSSTSLLDSVMGRKLARVSSSTVQVDAAQPSRRSPAVSDRRQLWRYRRHRRSTGTVTRGRIAIASGSPIVVVQAGQGQWIAYPIWSGSLACVARWATHAGAIVAFQEPATFDSLDCRATRLGSGKRSGNIAEFD